MDSDLSNGYCYQPFEQVGPDHYLADEVVNNNNFIIILPKEKRKRNVCCFLQTYNNNFSILYQLGKRKCKCLSEFFFGSSTFINNNY